MSAGCPSQKLPLWADFSFLIYVMDPHIPAADSQGFIPVEVVSYSDSDWAGCQRSRRSTSGSLIALYSVNLSSTSRTQASVSHSSAEAELYAMTQAAVDSLAIKHFIKELRSTILSREVKITLKTDSSAAKTMASRLGISRKSKHIELRPLWIQDILSEGVMSLAKVGTHHSPSDVLTKFVQSSVLGNHLPKLNLFKDSSVTQVFKASSDLVGITPIQGFHRDHRGSHVEDQRLARLYHVCAQPQGQVCMINFEAFQCHQEFMIQRFKSASGRLRRALTPPTPRRGSESSENSGHSNVQMQIQEDKNHVVNQNVSATSRWWSFIALTMSLMHYLVQGYQLSVVMIKKVKQITVMFVNVNQVFVTIIAIINRRKRQGQRRNQSRQTRLSGLQYLCTFILFNALFATCVFIAFRFMSFNQTSSQSSCLTAVSHSVESYSSQVFHLLSTSVVTLISGMAAAAQSTATVNEAAALVAKSLQSMAIAHAKNEELNNDAQVPIIRHALSRVESTQKD